MAGQREGIAAQEILVAASEKVDAIEEGLVKCSEAEMPFLKGIEILPSDESGKAIKDSEAAASKCSEIARSAEGFIKAKLVEVKKYSKGVAKSITDDLNEISNRMNSARE